MDPDKATWWIDLGDLHQHQSNFRQAMYDYNQAILVEPDNPLCWLGLARLLKQAGQCDDAMAAVSTFFDPSKPNLLALLLRGDIYRCQGDIQRAIVPDRWEIWDTRAAVSAENGDFQDAVSWEERCLERKDLSDAERSRATERLALLSRGKAISATARVTTSFGFEVYDNILSTAAST